MKVFRFFLVLILLNTLCLQPAISRPGEAVEKVLNRYSVEGVQPFSQGNYVSYKIRDGKFVSEPTLFLKLGAKGVILEQNFLFDKNTVHEKDVERAKGDSKPVVDILNFSYLVGDFSQLPRESFTTKDKVIGGFAAPLGSAVGSIVGAGKGAFHGTKIGFGTAQAASRALSGDVSGKAGAWASSFAAVTTGAVTGLFGGLTGGAVEGSVRGARITKEGLSGADMKIEGAIPAVSSYTVIGGRIGKALSADEQRSLLNDLSELERQRLASEGLDLGNTANLQKDQDQTDSYLGDLDSAKPKSDFDEDSSNYFPEDAENSNVAGMW